jgi:hypothetical protein
MATIRNNKGTVLVALGLAVLALSLALAAPGHGATPPGDRDVRVVNTAAEAVPVAGGVSITNSPAVTVQNTANVLVTNAEAAPVLARDVDRPSRQPFSRRVSMIIPAGQTFGGSPDLEFTVPAGKVLVIESVSFKVETQADQSVIAAFAAYSGNVATDYFVPLAVTPLAGLHYHQAAASFKVYADGGRPVWGAVRLSHNVSGAAVWFSVAGHLVDAP